MHALKNTLMAAALLSQCWLAAPAQPAAAPVPLIRDGLAPTDPLVAASLPGYLQSRSARFVDWLSDGSLLIATRFGDTLQIHRVRNPLGMREQLTFAPEGVLAAAARPLSSDALLYVTAQPGGGTQLYLQQLSGVIPPAHVLRALTSGEEQISTPRWAPDGARIAYVSTRRGASDATVYVIDTRVPQALPRLVAAGNGARWRIDGWSPDGRHLLLGRIDAPSSGTALQSAVAAGALEAGDLADASGAALPTTALYVADVDSGTVSPLSVPQSDPTHGRRARHTPEPNAYGVGGAAGAALTASSARFASDGTGVLLLTHGLGSGASPHEYQQLVYLDRADGRSTVLSTPTDHDVRLFDQSADGRYIAYTLDENGTSRLMLLDQRLKLQLPVSSLPTGIISSLRFDASGRRLAITLESTRSPADVYVLDTAGNTLTRWTHSEVGLLDTQAFVEPQLLHFSTWDRIDGQDRQLLALGYNPGPDTVGAGAPRPVIVWLCSGGGAQCRPRFAPFVQYLVRELGCVVIAPDVRGSSGLGQSLQSAGQGSLRDDAVRDIGSLLVWIGLQPGLDHTRVALLGEGYGSYLALQSLSQYGDRVLGAVAAFPPGLTGLANVEAIRRPVLLVQGLADWNVPAYEGAQLREGLRAQGVPVEYLAAANEGVDFARHSTRSAYQLAAASFLARLLR